MGGEKKARKRKEKERTSRKHDGVSQDSLFSGPELRSYMPLLIGFFFFPPSIYSSCLLLSSTFFSIFPLSAIFFCRFLLPFYNFFSLSLSLVRSFHLAISPSSLIFLFHPLFFIPIPPPPLCFFSFLMRVSPLFSCFLLPLRTHFSFAIFQPPSVCLFTAGFSLFTPSRFALAVAIPHCLPLRLLDSATCVFALFPTLPSSTLYPLQYIPIFRTFVKCTSIWRFERVCIYSVTIIYGWHIFRVPIKVGGSGKRCENKRKKTRVYPRTKWLASGLAPSLDSYYHPLPHWAKTPLEERSNCSVEKKIFKQKQQQQHAPQNAPLVVSLLLFFYWKTSKIFDHDARE